MRVGLIADTHGVLRPQALAFLRGCDHIVHAGDIGGEAILEALRALAPLTAVRGNNDGGAWAAGLPETQQVTLAGTRLYVLHERARLDCDPAGAGVQVVVYGHSHRPLLEWREGVLFINPGSAGRRRFSLPVTVGELVLGGKAIAARIVPLAVAPPGVPGR